MNTKTVSFYYLDAPEPKVSTRASLSDELLRVALAINRGGTAEELIDLIFEALDALVPHDRIGIARLGGQGILTSQYVRSRLPILWGKGASAPLNGSSLGPIVYERKIRIIDDLPLYGNEHPNSRTTAWLVKEGMRSSLTLPISTGAGPIGVIFFSSVHCHAYGRKHVAFLRTLAAGIGIAFERADLLESLRRANAELKTLDDLKSDFLSNMSHELRTPLARVLGSAYALKDGLASELEPEQAPLLEDVIVGAERLKALLGDLFDFTAFEAGRMRLDRVSLDLGALAIEVAEEFRSAIEALGLQLELGPHATPVIVNGSAPMLARAFQALLDNACKFTPAPGKVSVAVGTDGDRGWVEVRDTGIGIPEELQGKVFRKFFQVDSGAARAFGGAGLGLALVRAIVRAHDGVIFFESTPGKGSRFRLNFPTAIAAL